MRDIILPAQEVLVDAYRFHIRSTGYLKVFSFLGIPKRDVGALLVPVQFSLYIVHGIPGGGGTKEIAFQVLHLHLAPGHLLPGKWVGQGFPGVAAAVGETAFNLFKEGPRSYGGGKKEEFGNESQ